MKTKLVIKRCSRSGYALVMVLLLIVASMIIMAGTLSRTYTVSRLNDSSNEFIVCQNAAEAAVEKVYARMQYDFQSGGGSGTVAGNLNNYRTTPPGASETAYWGGFQFTDGTTAGRTYVSQIGTFTGQLPQAYNGRNTANAPIYRLVSNARLTGGSVIGTAQQDVMLALVPLTTYAIFYNGLLEFSTCATMTVNGAVHCNTNIYVGAGGSSTLTFNSTVTASGTITAPRNNDVTWGNANANINNAWRTYFNGVPKTTPGIASIQISIPMSNTHSIIEMPTTPNDYTNAVGAQRLYNQAHVIILVSNSSVFTKIQISPSSAELPAADQSPYTRTYSTNSGFLWTNLPFLTISNSFRDQREDKTNLTTQIDVGKYAIWLSTNTQILAAGGKFYNSATYPTILYVADNRTVNGNQLTVVRLTNGIAPPKNGGQGFSVATPNPLYVWGNYNCTNSSHLGTTNTSTTVPCAFMSDALTILSSSWSDRNSLISDYSDGSASWNAAAQTTVNAAIVTGIVPSTGTDKMHFSGGVHNLPRLLEDWGSSHLWINTSIVNLFNSTRANGQFLNPGYSYSYYMPPTRHFSYDINFSNPNRVPPGIPCALVALRYGWAVPPPHTTSFNVTP